MKIVHIISDSVVERAQKVIWPICNTSEHHESIYLSQVEPIHQKKSNHWVEVGRRMDPKSILRFSKALSSLKPDIVHMHGVELIPFVMAGSGKLNFKKVVSTYRPKSGNWLRKTLEAFVGQSMRWVDVVVFNSTKLEHMYIESGLPIRKSRVVLDATGVPRSTNELEFQDWLLGQSEEFNAKPFFVAFPGSVRSQVGAWRKGFETIEPKLRPNILLEQKDFDRFKAKKKRPKFVRLLPDQFRMAAAKLAAGCIIANPEYFLSLNLSEYFHQGCPVIGPSGSGLSDLAINHVNARLVHPKRVEDWAMAVNDVANDFAYRERLKKGARFVALQNLTLVRWANDIEKVYEQI